MVVLEQGALQASTSLLLGIPCSKAAGAGKELSVSEALESTAIWKRQCWAWWIQNLFCFVNRPEESLQVANATRAVSDLNRVCFPWIMLHAWIRSKTCKIYLGCRNWWCRQHQNSVPVAKSTWPVFLGVPQQLLWSTAESRSAGSSVMRFLLLGHFYPSHLAYIWQSPLFPFFRCIALSQSLFKPYCWYLRFHNNSLAKAWRIQAKHMKQDSFSSPATPKLQTFC